MSTTLSVLPFRSIVILFLMAALAAAGEREARAAEKAENRGDYVDAYLKYSQAVEKGS